MVAIFATCLSLAILYHIIKAAVKNAMLEVRRMTDSVYSAPPVQEVKGPYTPKQQELQDKYEAGKISIDEYQQEFYKP